MGSRLLPRIGQMPMVERLAGVGIGALLFGCAAGFFGAPQELYAVPVVGGAFLVVFAGLWDGLAEAARRARR